MRIIPTADVTLHVAPPTIVSGSYWTPGVPVTVAGDDATGDGSQTSPFATPQKAHDTFAENYDLQFKWKPTIQLAVAPSPGQIFYPGLKVSGRLIGQAGTLPRLTSGATSTYFLGKYLPYTLRGDPLNMTGAFFHPGAHGFANQPGLTLTEGAMKVEGVTFDTKSGSTANADCIDVFGNAFLDIGNVWFGNAAFLHIGVAWNSALLFTAPIFVTGGAGIAFMQVAHSIVQGDSDSGSPLIPITISGSPSFPGGLIIIDHGVVYSSTLSITGAFTGGPMFVPIRGGYS
jgi:hypothetical protein